MHVIREKRHRAQYFSQWQFGYFADSLKGGLPVLARKEVNYGESEQPNILGIFGGDIGVPQIVLNVFP